MSLARRSVTMISPEAQVERQRRWMRPNAHLWIRPDAHRFMRPGSPRWYGRDAVRYFWPEAAAGTEPAERKYDPNQPRVPAGNPEGGQWTESGASSREQGRVSRASLVPKIPRQRPPTSNERVKVAKEIAIWIAEHGAAVGEVVVAGSWLYYAVPTIVSYLDGPKPLAELQRDFGVRRAGYDWHHIVERSSALEDGYPLRRIDAPDNLVRIPRMRHWEINAWYQTKNDRFGEMTPRDYLRNKDWDERREIGLYALERFGVLKR